MKLTGVKKVNQKPSIRHPWCLVLSRTGLVFSLLGSSLLLCGVTGASWGRAYTQEKLAPQIADILSQTLDRPIQLGQIEQISPTGLRIGASSIPSTEHDRDRATVEAIEVKFNVMDLISTRKVNLTVTFIRPKLFIDQDKTGRWLNTDLVLDGEEVVEVNRVQLRDATIELAPIPKVLKPLVDNPEAQNISVAANHDVFQQVNLDLVISDADQRISFNLAGQPEAGGTFRVQGRAWLAEATATLKVKTDRFAVQSLNSFLPETVRLDSGSLDSRLTIQMGLNTPIALSGRAKLQDLATQVKGEPNLFTQGSGQFRFQGQQITVKQARTAYGQIVFEQLNGTLHLQDGLDLRGKVVSAGLPEVLQTFELDVPFSTHGVLQSDNLRVTGPLQGAVFSGTVYNTQPLGADRLTAKSFQGNFVYDTGADKLLLSQLELHPDVGGVLTADARILLGEEDKGEPDQVEQLTVQVTDVSGDAIAQEYGLNPPVALGLLNANAALSLMDDVPTAQLSWQLTEGTYPAEGQLTLEDQHLRLHDTQLQTANGAITAEGEVYDDRWTIAAQGENIPLSDLVLDKSSVDKFVLESPLANEQLTASTLDSSNNSSNNSSNPSLNNSLIHSSANSFTAKPLPADLLASELENPLGIESSAAETSGVLNASVQLTGKVDRPLESAQGILSAHIQMPSGMAAVNGMAQNGEWQASLQSQGMNLDAFSPELVGNLTGEITAEINAMGKLADLSLQTTQADGTIQVPQGLSSQHPFLSQPLMASFQWDGDKLHIHQAATAGLEMDGWIMPQAIAQRSLAIQEMNLNLHMQDYDLATLPLLNRLPVQLQGRADFNGRVTGTPSTPDLNGTLQLHNAVINHIELDPLLSGDVRLGDDRGLVLNLSGTPDRNQNPSQNSDQNPDQINLALDSENRIKHVLIRLNQAIAEVVPASETNADQNRLLATLQNVPLEMFNLSPIESLGVIRGVASGQFAIDLTNPTRPVATGELAIDQPGIGVMDAALHPNHRHDRFVGTVNYDNRSLVLSKGELLLGDGRYDIAGELIPGQDPQFRGQLMTNSGNLQDWITLMSPSQWQALLGHLGTIPLSQSLPVDQILANQTASPSPSPERPDQSHRYSLSFPDLSQLQGTFSTHIQVQHSHQSGLAANFNLQGQDWEWEDYRIHQVAIVNGQFNGTPLNGNQLTLAPVELRGLTYAPQNQPQQVFNSWVAFSGQVGTAQQSGQFQAENIPLAFLGQVLNIPIPLEGDLRASATLAGTAASPEIAGTVEVMDIYLNSHPLKDLQLMFSHRNNQFRVEDWLLMDEQPIAEQ